MDAIGIVAEWNPYHNGHAYCTHTMRKKYPDAPIMAVMSGPFTQRGGPSIIDKWCRAEMALADGIDLVFELPQIFATSSLETFARGGVQTLLATHCMTRLAFGSESGDEALLRRTANLLKSPTPEFEVTLRNLLAQGIPYGQAMQSALCQREATGAGSRNSPNDRLAIHYVRHLPVDFPLIVVPRRGDHHDEGTMPHTFASATRIRRGLLHREPMETHLPTSSQRLLEEMQTAGWVFPEVQKLFPLWQARIAGLGPQGLTDAWQITDGWPERCWRAMASAQNPESFLAEAQTRHYTRSRISRLLLDLLAPVHPATDTPPPYLRVLGFSSRGRELLKAVQEKAQVPVLGNLGRDARALSPEAAQILREDVARQDLAACLQSVAPFSNWGRDYQEAPRLGT